MWGRTEWLGAEYSVLGDFLWTLLTGQSQGRGLNAHVQHVSRDRKAGSVSTGSAVATSPGLERPQGWSAHARPQPRDIRGLGLTLVRRSRLEGPPRVLVALRHEPSIPGAVGWGAKHSLRSLKRVRTRRYAPSNNGLPST